MLTFNRQDRGSVVVLAIVGHLDALTAGELKLEIERMVSNQTKACVLDMVGVELVDSTGIGSIISLFKRLRAQGGDLKIACVIGQPKQIFDLLRLDRALAIHERVDEAVAAFSR